MAIETTARPAEDRRLMVRPLVDAARAKQEFADYQGLVKDLLEASDYQTFREKGQLRRFKKKSAWRKLRRFFGFDLELRDERIGHRHSKTDCPRLVVVEVREGGAVRPFEGEKDCGCPTVYSRYVVRATDPRTGQFVDGIGVSSLGEKNRVFTKPDHEIPSTAYTRAANRAISDLIGAGEDSAEEVRGVGGVTGLSLEDKKAIKDAWNAAPQEVREKAMAQLREWTFAGANVAEIFTDFNRRAGEEAVEDLLTILGGGDPGEFNPEAKEGDKAFDPDLVAAAHGETPPPAAGPKKGGAK